MKVRVIATLVMALCLAVGSASASSIAVFFASDASDCDASVPANTPGTMYIIAILGGDALAQGMTTAEFRMDGFPGGWFGSPTANPVANVVIGSPTTGGTNIAFPSCQTGPRVLLFTINFFATSGVAETYLTIDRHTNPSSPAFQCPLMTMCDATFTKVCVPGGQAIMNGRPCTVGVEPMSWSSVKGLYNN